MLKSIDFRKQSSARSTPGHIPKLNLSNVASEKKTRPGRNTSIASARKQRREQTVSVSPRVDKERVRMVLKKGPKMETVDNVDPDVEGLQSQLTICSEKNDKLSEQLEISKATNEFLTDKVRRLETQYTASKSSWAEERIKLQQTILKLQQVIADSSDTSPNFMSGLMG